MKKNNTSMTKITIFLVFLIVLVVGYYSYLSGKNRTEQQEAVMSEVDTALSRDLNNNYPATLLPPSGSFSSPLTASKYSCGRYGAAMN